MLPRLFDPDSPRADGAPLTVGEVVSQYLEAGCRGKCERSTADKRHVLTAFCAVHGAMPVADAKPFHLRLWVDSQEQLKSDWSVKRWIASVKAAFGWAVKLGIIDRHPFLGVTQSPGKRGRPLELWEFQAMLRASTPIFRRALIFLRFTGCRPGEMSIAEWCHFQPARACIELPKHKTEKKTHKPRRIMLHPAAMKLLAWIRRHEPHARYIFINAKGRPWERTAISWRLKQIRERAGISPDTTLYGARHLYAVQAILNDVDVATLCPLMGHERVATTMYYADVASRTDHLQAAVAKIFKRPK